jgi:hypothetical protein
LNNHQILALNLLFDVFSVSFVKFYVWLGIIYHLLLTCRNLTTQVITYSICQIYHCQCCCHLPYSIELFEPLYLGIYYCSGYVFVYYLWLQNVLILPKLMLLFLMQGNLNHIILYNHTFTIVLYAQTPCYILQLLCIESPRLAFALSTASNSNCKNYIFNWFETLSQLASLLYASKPIQHNYY